jgi:hypothetical protein
MDILLQVLINLSKFVAVISMIIAGVLIAADCWRYHK